MIALVTIAAVAGHWAWGWPGAVAFGILALIAILIWGDQW